MQSTIGMMLAVLAAMGILIIGGFYIGAPQRVSGSFGLRMPTADADTKAWLRLKGIRDSASGLAVLTMLAAGDIRAVGMLMLVFAIIPFGDMSNILASGGSKTTALSVHGVTCAVMIVAGLLLIHTI